MTEPLEPMLTAPSGDLFGVGCVVRYAAFGSLQIRTVLVEEIDLPGEGVEPAFAGTCFDTDDGMPLAAVWGYARQVFHVEQGPYESTEDAAEFLRHVWDMEDGRG